MSSSKQVLWYRKQEFWFKIIELLIIASATFINIIHTFYPVMEKGS